MGFDESHCIVDEDSGCPAVGIAHDLPADRVRCIRVDPRNFHCGTVGPCGMAVDTAHPDRPVGNHGVDILRTREFTLRP